MPKPITSFRFVTSPVLAESRIVEAEPINLRTLRDDVNGVAQKNTPSRAARQAVRSLRFRRSRSEVFCSTHSGKKTLTEPFRVRYFGFASAADYQLCFKAMRRNYSTALNSIETVILWIRWNGAIPCADKVLQTPFIPKIRKFAGNGWT